MIHVGELIYDPDFTQIVKVYRTTGSIENHRFVSSSTSFTINAVVTVSSDTDLSMFSDADKIGGGINVFTKDMLYLTSHVGEQEYISDEVEYLGNRYKVMSISPYVQYGFSRAVCTLMRRT